MRCYVQTNHHLIDLPKTQQEVNFIQFNYLTFEIHGTNEYTCPVECMAVFAHDKDIDYADVINEESNARIIKLFDSCKSVRQVEILRSLYPGVVPKITKACRYFDHVNGTRSR